jgi:hypothetical protein
MYFANHVFINIFTYLFLEDKVLVRIFKHIRDKVTGKWAELHFGGCSKFVIFRILSWMGET